MSMERLQLQSKVFKQFYLIFEVSFKDELILCTVRNCLFNLLFKNILIAYSINVFLESL